MFSNVLCLFLHSCLVFIEIEDLVFCFVNWQERTS